MAGVPGNQQQQFDFTRDNWPVLLAYPAFTHPER